MEVDLESLRGDTRGASGLAGWVCPADSYMSNSAGAHKSAKKVKLFRWSSSATKDRGWFSKCALVDPTMGTCEDCRNQSNQDWQQQRAMWTSIGCLT